MTSRNYGAYGWSIHDIPIIDMWWSGTDSGGSLGVKHLGRNIHLTVCMRDGQLNAHITDDGKDPQCIWNMDVQINELYGIVEQWLNSAIQRYRWYHRYLQLSDELNALFLSQAGNSLGRWFDVEPFFKGFIKEGAMKKKRIRTGFYEGNRMGLVRGREDVFFVIPMSRTHIFRMIIDPSKSPLWEIPTVQGMIRYIRYLDDEDIFKQMGQFSPEQKRQIEAALLHLFSDATRNQLISYPPLENDATTENTEI